MRFLLQIELGNDAMQSRNDVARGISHALTRQSDYGTMSRPLEAGEGEIIRDGNGNTVGLWEVEADAT